MANLSNINNKFIVEDSGDVGIGVTSATTKLHIGGTAPGDSIIRQDSTVSGTNWEIGERAAGKWQIFEDDSDTIVTTFMSTGNVGIGTDSPTEKLHLKSTTSGSFIRFEDNGGSGVYVGARSNDLEFYAGGSEKMVILSGGNVGIGVTNPSSYWANANNLVVGGLGAVSGITIATDGNLTGSLIFADSTAAADNTRGGLQYNHSNDSMLFRVDNDTKMTILSSGNVGIGTDSPAEKLTIDGTVSGAYVRISNAASGDISSGYTIYNGNNLDYAVYTNPTFGNTTLLTREALAIRAGGSQRMTILSGGNVGIVETSPTATLQVNGDIKIGSGAGSGTDSNNMSIQVSNATYGDTSNLGLLVRNNGANGEFAQIGFGYSETKCPVVIGSVITSGSGATKGDFIIGTRDSTTGSVSPTERMRITSVGYFKASNNGNYFSSTGTYHELTQVTGGDWSTIIHNDTSAPYGLLVKYSSVSPNNAGAEFYYAADSSSARFIVRSNGGIANFQSNDTNLSDERLKNNIENCDNYLDKICSIPVKLFNYKDEAEGTPKNLGVIAQEVEAIAPELVNNDGFGETPEDGIPLKTVYSTDMMYALMKAIQELKADNDSLKARIEMLENI